MHKHKFTESKDSKSFGSKPACLWVHFTSDIWTENACLRPQQSGVSWSRRPSQAISCLPDTDQGAGNGDNQWRGDTVLLRTLATGGLEEGGDTNTQSGGSTSHQRLSVGGDEDNTECVTATTKEQLEYLRSAAATVCRSSWGKAGLDLTILSRLESHCEANSRGFVWIYQGLHHSSATHSGQPRTNKSRLGGF